MFAKRERSCPRCSNKIELPPSRMDSTDERSHNSPTEARALVVGVLSSIESLRLLLTSDESNTGNSHFGGHPPRRSPRLLRIPAAANPRHRLHSKGGNDRDSG